MDDSIPSQCHHKCLMGHFSAVFIGEAMSLHAWCGRASMPTTRWRLPQVTIFEHEKPTNNRLKVTFAPSTRSARLRTPHNDNNAPQSSSRIPSPSGTSRSTSTSLASFPSQSLRIHSSSKVKQLVLPSSPSSSTIGSLPLALWMSG